MTPKQAALMIGCSPGQVRTLIRSGTLQATKRLLPYGGFMYDVSRSSVLRYLSKPQTVGYPRGRKRS